MSGPHDPSSESTQGGPPPSRWRQALHDGLRGRAEPVLVFPASTTTAASLWAASRLWVELFRASGLRPGDRVVLASEATPGFAAFLVAALWESLTIAVHAPATGGSDLLETFDARLGLGCDGLSADGAGCPVVPDGWRARDAAGEPTPDARVLMRTSGTSGSPTWIALSDENLWTGLDSHRPHLLRRGDTVLSVLPWHHAFGLVIDLIPALLSAGMIVREASSGRSPASMIEAAARWEAQWCCMVPLQVQRLSESPEGLAMLRSLSGGVVGGASVSAPLAEVLSTTRLRVGYGLTEAAPGVSLGRAGEWIAGAIGTPLGCELDVSPEGRLLVRGTNVCLGTWSRAGLERRAADRWLDTGDLVRRQGEHLIYLGRADSNFKLANGRMVNAARIEHELRESIAGLSDAVVCSPDGERLRVYLVMRPGRPTPNVDGVRRVLGPLAEKLEGVTVRAETAELRTGKGSLNRARLLAA